ncbi:PREDICTED: transport and Golgi organization protein 11 [Nicrophorus vespilloides]|uniref:Transport and Golgi organization protein 11 n=1 Tax=Nicrophorus vespilloides TaxID=110193 RepID=A0ABM1NF45_NICVS|nr:PREDICTED: transport and Golgi organization protein 11 [Nicrophorus vespilloides]
MSANGISPNYSELEDAFITDANFKVDISQKMQVPNKISFSSESLNGGPHWNENINMQVPERILVVGQHQHMGTRAPPREIAFDNSLLPTEPYPCDLRVATPPRTLTLDRYPFPDANFEEPEPEPKPRAHQAKQIARFDLNDSSILHRESSPPIGAGGDTLSANDEVLHLRRQMAKLNRRVMALELEHLGRLQKEKIVYGLGIAYFLLKAIIWLNRT